MTPETLETFEIGFLRVQYFGPVSKLHITTEPKPPEGIVARATLHVGPQTAPLTEASDYGMLSAYVTYGAIDSVIALSQAGSSEPRGFGEDGLGPASALTRTIYAEGIIGPSTRWVIFRPESEAILLVAVSQGMSERFDPQRGIQ